MCVCSGAFISGCVLSGLVIDLITFIVNEIEDEALGTKEPNNDDGGQITTKATTAVDVSLAMSMEYLIRTRNRQLQPNTQSIAVSATSRPKPKKKKLATNIIRMRTPTDAQRCRTVLMKMFPELKSRGSVVGNERIHDGTTHIPAVSHTQNQMHVFVLIRPIRHKVVD